MGNDATDTFVVRVSFVDSTYWDDGSRWTSKIFKFNKRSEAIKFAQEACGVGCDVEGQCGRLRVWPKEEDIMVEKTSTSIVNWSMPKKKKETK